MNKIKILTRGTIRSHTCAMTHVQPVLSAACLRCGAEFVELTFEKFEQIVVKDDVLKIRKSPITTKCTVENKC